MPGSAGVPPANNKNENKECGRDARAPRGRDAPDESPYLGWHSRGYLPHFDGGEFSQFITFRLYDSLPAALLNKWRDMLEHLPITEAEAELRNRIEEHLDKGVGNAWLINPDIACAIENALLHFDGLRYRLHSWVVMPNHVHALLTPSAEHGIPGIIHSLKSFTAKEANRLTGMKGKFWQPDYYDRYIRNEDHYYMTIEYIEMNPVKAGLCESREQWEFGSARRACPGSAGVPPANKERKQRE